MRLVWIVGALALSVPACINKPAFHCTKASDCAATGAVCESVGYCSFVDTGCSGGRRFGDLSGTYSDQCVGAVVGDGGVGDGRSGDCWAAWKQGTISFASTARIAELVNPSAQEHPSLSDDLTLYFDRTVPGRLRDFYVATRSAVGQPWGAANEVTELDSTLDEERITVTPDSTYAVFSSTRSGGAPVLWAAARPTGTGAFGAPAQNDVAQVNVNASEFDPQLSRDGLRLYHSPGLFNGTQVIAVSSRASTSSPFGAPMTLAPLSVSPVVGDPALSPDELVIVIAASMGPARAMYYATRPSLGAAFSTPVAVPGVSPGGTYDGNGTLSSTGCELIFMSNRGGVKELYVAVAN